MNHWKEEQLQRLGSIQDEQELLELLPSLIWQLGYAYYRYIKLSQGAAPWIRNNYPEEWNRYYQEHNIQEIDPGTDLHPAFAPARALVCGDRCQGTRVLGQKAIVWHALRLVPGGSAYPGSPEHPLRFPPRG
ncbi:autoinducer binding domain-containing protein [Pseudomonas gingeri]|nr:autoinducer binding domain-containing protein [Pseudomonas gingeri]